MKSARILPISFLVSATLLSGLTIATAQTISDADAAQSQNPAITLVDDRRAHGGRAGRDVMRGIMTVIDTDQDGTITATELDAYTDSQLAEADQSGDGVISLDEFEEVRRRQARPRTVEGFQNLDADGDGAVTAEELDRRTDRIRERMDRNDDGVINSDDRRERGARGGRRDRDGHGRRG